MALVERGQLLAVGAAVAMASAVGVLLLDRERPEASAAMASVDGLITSPRVLSVRARAMPAPLAEPASDRFAFVSFGDFPLHLGPGEENWSTAANVAPEIADGWMAETKAEPRRVVPAAPAQTAVKLASLTPQRYTPGAVPSIAGRIYTLTERLNEISPGATARLAAKFEAAKVPWPPADMALVAIKDEKALELFARPAGGAWKFVHRYDVLAASGGAGPKLREGDKQVPEGVYGISFLNPNSRYHVSMRVNYPNAFDREMAQKDGRQRLGGDIMIHGKAVSVGCLAVGDEAAEELFLLASTVSLTHVKLVIAPTDFRRSGMPKLDAASPKWVPALYTEIAGALSEFKSPPRSSGLLSFFTGGN